MAQDSEFAIGIFASISGYDFPSPSGCNTLCPYSLDSIGQKTSNLNVLAEDGFNIIQTYHPNEWTSLEELKAEINLAGMNNLKVLLGTGINYKPLVDGNGRYRLIGVNDYLNCGKQYHPCESPYSVGYFMHNLNDIMTLAQSPRIKDLIWGHFLSEESSYYHFKHFDPHCKGNRWQDSQYFINVEVPPVNILRAFQHFDSLTIELGNTKQKLVISEANHHKTINSLTDDQEGFWNPQDYIQLLVPHHDRSVFFESSYTQFPPGWASQDYSVTFTPNGYHYLGKFSSVSYAISLGIPTHKVIASYISNFDEEGNIIDYQKPDGTGLLTHTHSSPLFNQNANWLWFQTYTSIVHGASGVWYWWLPNMWSPGEDHLVWERKTQADRFERQYFPRYYREYLAHLARELAWLKGQGFLNPGTYTELGRKTDAPDAHGLVPHANEYMPRSLPREKRSSPYTIRYSLRSNQNGGYILLATNPINEPVEVCLDFGHFMASEPALARLSGAKVLFAKKQDPAANTYKAQRSAHINLQTGQMESYHYLAAHEGKMTVPFGPMDVVVLQLITDSAVQHALPRFFQLYPNPARQQVAVSSLIPIAEITQIDMYNTLGMNIWQTNDVATYMSGPYQLNLPLGTLAAGHYLVHIAGSDFVQTLPLVVMP